MNSEEFYFNFILPQTRLILEFSNLSVLHKGLLMQDWVFRLEFLDYCTLDSNNIKIRGVIKLLMKPRNYLGHNIYSAILALQNKIT
jgi:hypothetical protein